VGALLASLALPFVWVALPSWSLWGWLVVMGCAASIGHFMLIVAYKRTQASTLTPYLYAQVGFAMLGGWLAFSHVPDRWALLGIAMIALCGALGAWLAVREGKVLIQPAES